VQLNNYTLFLDQLPDTVKQYNNLKIVQDINGISYLEGILDITDDNNEIVGHFLVEIHCSENFPYRFPILYETGGEIPNIPDWHKYNDNSCCITFWTDEVLKCKNGIKVSYFIEKHAIPYFANHMHRKQKGEYKNGEYAHGIPALFQYYESLMKTNSRDLWIQYYKNTFQNLKIECERNDLCICGSGKKFKSCHLEIFNALRQIGEKQIIFDFILMKI
jgi:hypothetical protein